MLPTRWEPFRSLSKELSSMHREMDELFRRTFGFGEEASAREGFSMAPAINTYTKDNRYCVEAELPGVGKDDLDVNIEGDILTLRGERRADKETKEEDYYIRESRYGSFIRRLPLPEGVDTDQVSAKFEDGILRISMPIEKKLAKGRKVMIEGPEKEQKEKKVH